MPGYVYLVGVGPGEPDCITQRVLDVLAQADVVLYDYLVHPSVLAHVPQPATVVCVGKQRGRHSQTQVQINAQMIDYAKQGRCVVRLKGGSPTVFGRGGEEMGALTEAGIAFELIPGVSSVFGVLERVGIPVTHRDCARSVAVVSGASAHQGEWRGRVPNADTLIAVMAVKNSTAFIQQVLADTDHTPDTPAAIIYKGTSAHEQVWVTTVGGMQAIASEVQSPALVVIGPVVRYREYCEGYRQGPLTGTRIVSLRPQSPVALPTTRVSWEAQWQADGADVVRYPVQDIHRIAAPMVPVDTADWVVFTSQIAVGCFVDWLREHRLDWRSVSGKVVAVGSATAAALRSVGIEADGVAEQSDQEGVLELLPQTMAGQVVLFPCSERARPMLTDTVTQRGGQVVVLPVYTAVTQQRYTVPLYDGDCVVFTSAGTVAAFFEKHETVPDIVAWVWGERTKQALRDYFSGPIRLVENMLNNQCS